jgi:hypothetical protein
MSGTTRSLSNLPDYYSNLNAKQKSNWRRNTRKIERNEELRAQHPPYHPSCNIIVIHLHHQTKVDTVEQLIKKAEETDLYAVDTESETRDGRNHGALIQIQMVHSINYSTIILIEVTYLPDPTSLLYQQMEKLWSTIFGNNHEIISWGPYEKEMENFKHLDLIQSGKKFRKSNLQLQFQRWYDGEAHPEMESRDNETVFELEIEYSDDDIFNNDIFDYDIKNGRNNSSKKKSDNEWSLQNAVKTILGKFLDKTETENKWQCGIDLELNTWKQQSFNQKQYDQQKEQQRRLKMQQYAIHDCTALPELYFHMYPNKLNIYQEPRTASTSTPTLTTVTPIKIINNYIDQLSDVSEDDLAGTLVPKFNQKPPQGTTTKTSPKQKTTTTTSPEQRTTTTTAVLSKQERQRRKNDKLKWKQRNRPDYQLKIRRPIYYKYDYHKIRSQLLDDDIHTSHQLTINRKKQEVLIGFKSIHEQQKAKLIMRINYFSREQFKKRWGEK